MTDRIPADPAPAERAVQRLRDSGVDMVEVSFVDNAGIVRVKAVPLDRLPAIAATGVGASPCFETFGADDIGDVGRYLGGPDGDLRLVPDVRRLVRLAAVPGWAWAPADKFTQDGARFVACQRAFAARQVDAAQRLGLRQVMAIEHEWVLGADSDEFAPALHGPAYGQVRLEQVAGYARDLVAALRAQGLTVEQFHPEYATAQLELSVAPNDPVGAADDALLVRHTIRSVSRDHGRRACFAPSVDGVGVGSGAHLHFSVHDADGPAFHGGDGPLGLRTSGQAFLAGVLRELPALVAISAGHPASFLRLRPSRWAGAWQCWGHETREAALRMITGVVGTEQQSANAELKCVDAGANPYLLVGAVIAAGLAGVGDDLRLPAPITGDPATFPEPDRVPPLPATAAEAAAALESSTVLAAALGPELHDAIITVRRGEHRRCADLSGTDLAAATRWVW